MKGQTLRKQEPAPKRLFKNTLTYSGGTKD